MNDLQKTIIPESEPMETLLSMMDKGFREMWIKVWVDESPGKLGVAVHSTHVIIERKEFASLLALIAGSLIGADWENVAGFGNFIACRSCFDHVLESNVLPLVCSDCGRGVEDYVEKKTDR